MDKDQLINIAILASGTGSNAKNICNYFKDHPNIKVGLILTNKEKAGVKFVAEEFKIPFCYTSSTQFKESNSVLHLLKHNNIDLIVLAGFLLLVPDYLIQEYPNRIINIHPALLPDFGGKGMYGHYVHEMVSKSGKLESGITIHYINNNYDEGEIIFQKNVSITPGEDPAIIEQKVRMLEIEHFPRVIENVILKFTKFEQNINNMSKIDLLNKSRITAMKEKNEIAKALFSTLKGEYENAIKTGSPQDDSTIEKLARKMTENAKVIGNSESLTEIELLKPYMPVLMSESQVREIVQKVISVNPDKANNYKLGSKGSITGMVMKEIAGKADANLIKEIIEKELN